MSKGTILEVYVKVHNKNKQNSAKVIRVLTVLTAFSHT